MGAWYDSRNGAGSDLRSAFNSVVREAQYEDGHGGYTGTMAEKHEAVLIAAPVSPRGRRMTVDKFERLACELADHVQSAAYEADELRWVEQSLRVAKPGTIRATKAMANRKKKEIAKARKDRERAWKKVPDYARANVARLIEVAHGDKWGPAAAVELQGSELAKAKKSMGLAGRRGVRVFRFMGYCSS